MTASVDYPALQTHLRRVHLLSSIGELLGWDEQVNLPADSAEQRGAQRAVLAEQQHGAATAPEIGELLTKLEAASAELTEDQRIVVRWARRNFERARRLPVEFVTEKALHSSRGYQDWLEARTAKDFSRFAPALAKHIDLARREAAYQGFGDAYDYMLDCHDPGITAAAIRRLFDELKEGLVPLARKITAQAAQRKPAELVGFPVATQAVFLREVAEQIGFDFRRGRIDVSVHPFCSGTGADVRMTTRFEADQPLDALFSAIHETGHGLYEQGLDAGNRHNALGQHAGMGAHESQSRLWENQIARSRGFWRHFEPRFRALFPGQLSRVTADELYSTINHVNPTLIRVDADEVTYNLHIILRFELEQRLFAGELSVSDLPAAWNDASERLLGLRPSHDADGVLQDIHWSDGAFGYFPSYCLGNMLAAQLWQRMRDLRPGLEEDFAHGDFSWALGWLRREIHARGRRFDLLELARLSTGEALTPRYLLQYLRGRYA